MLVFSSREGRLETLSVLRTYRFGRYLRVRRKPPVPSLTPFAPTPRSSWQATMADEHHEPMEVAGELARRRC